MLINIELKEIKDIPLYYMHECESDIIQGQPKRGVYFLLKEDYTLTRIDVRYIGQSEHIQNRIKQHISDRFTFNAFSYIEFKSDIDRYIAELIYISMYKPDMNKYPKNLKENSIIMKYK